MAEEFGTEWTAPADDEVRVVVFGKNRGESILVHVADGEWIVVDSMVGHWPFGGGVARQLLEPPNPARATPPLPAEMTPPALDYLEKVGAKPTDVSAIVLTHLHADHGDGLHMLVEKCPAATLWFPDALKNTAWGRMINRARSEAVKADRRAFDSIATAYLMAVGKEKVDRIGAHTSLPLRLPDEVGELRALAPFGRVKRLELMPNDMKDRRVQRKVDRHNATSIVLWLRIGEARALLGADLENDRECGWEGLMAEHKERSSLRGARLVKVPHHGSEGSQWAEMYRQWTDRPIGVMTPNRRGGYELPDLDRIDILRAETSELWMAGHRLARPPADQQPVRGSDDVWVIEASAPGRGPDWTIRYHDRDAQLVHTADPA